MLKFPHFFSLYSTHCFCYFSSRFFLKKFFLTHYNFGSSTYNSFYFLILHFKKLLLNFFSSFYFLKKTEIKNLLFLALDLKFLRNTFFLFCSPLFFKKNTFFLFVKNSVIAVPIVPLLFQLKIPFSFFFAFFIRYEN